ncbi:ATP synthase gamma chain, chloroplastic-like protein [Drosera capensis]
MSCSSSSLGFRVSSRVSIHGGRMMSLISEAYPFQFMVKYGTPFRGSGYCGGRGRIRCGLNRLKDRINAVISTKKITEAMKLISAAKVRRAQEAVITGRPFAEALAQMLYIINERLQGEDVDAPLSEVRTVSRVALVVMTGDSGLCGGFNNVVIRKAETRIDELRELGVECTVISVGKKGNAYFSARQDVKVDRFIESEGFPTAKEAQVIADDVFSLFVSEEVDKVELLYTKFVSLLNSVPVIRTLLPLSKKGEIMDANGNCVDVIDDELFRLTTKEGKLTVVREKASSKRMELEPLMIFEQDPVHILDAMLPLYLNSQILRALQESLASELAARMNAMSNATDNADELTKSLSLEYYRKRQAKVTNELLEIVAGAEALNSLD